MLRWISKSRMLERRVGLSGWTLSLSLVLEGPCSKKQDVGTRIVLESSRSEVKEVGTVSMTEPSKGEGSRVESSEDSSEDNSMVEAGSEGAILLGRPRRWVEQRREEAGGGWVAFPIQDRKTQGNADGPLDCREDVRCVGCASRARMIGGTEDEGVALAAPCLFWEAIVEKEAEEK